MTDTLVGIVIKKVQLNADDEVVTILTSDEIVSFIALGTRKLKSKNRIALDYGNIITAEIFRARLKNKLSKLKKAVLLKQPPLKTSDTATVIIQVVKLLGKLENPSEMLFNSIIKAFQHLGDTHNHNVKTYIYFKALDSLGVYPNVSSCVECGRTDRIVDFDYKDGGYKCAWHNKKERPLEELKALQMLDKDLISYLEVDPLLNKRLFEELKQIIRDYIFI